MLSKLATVYDLEESAAYLGAHLITIPAALANRHEKRKPPGLPLGHFPEPLLDPRRENLGTQACRRQLARRAVCIRTELDIHD